MSTGVISRQVGKENSASTEHVKKATLTAGMNERKTLKTLQLSSDGRLLGLEKSMHKSRIVPSKKPLKIFPDTSTPKSVKTFKHVEIGVQVGIDKQESETQTEVSGATGITTGNVRECHNDSGVGVTDVDQEAYDLMVKDPIPESYWRELAEERRLSLAEALSENEVLHQSMEELKEENQNLSLLAGQAEHLASILNDALGEEGEKDKEDKEDATKETDVTKDTDDLTKDTDDVTTDTDDECKTTNTQTTDTTSNEEETKSTQPETQAENNS